jgi:hypothetical protein
MRINPFRVEIQDLEGQFLLLTKYRWWRPSHIAKVSWSDTGASPTFFWVNEDTGGGIMVAYSDKPYWGALQKWAKNRKEKKEAAEAAKKKAQHEQYMKSVLKPVKKTAKLPEAKVHKS